MGVVVDAYGQRKANEVMRDTWGHMDARPGVKYKGTILVAAGEFGGDRMILRSEFGNAGYGPWFYEGIHGWLSEQPVEDGKLYHFTGYYRLRRGGEHEFTGTTTEIPVTTD
jgi:hypothetical protein